MASDFEKPDRIHTLFPEEIREKMWPLPIGELYMAGRSSVETLKKLEINTIGRSGSGRSESDYPASEESWENAVGVRQRDRNRCSTV